MAGEDQRETLTLEEQETVEADEEEAEETEIRELEREVSNMARRILDLRRSIPDRLVSALSSRLVAERPPSTEAAESPSLSGPPGGATADSESEFRDKSELAEEAPISEADQHIFEKLQIFRAKSATNIAALPAILKRVSECIVMVDKFEEYDINIDPVFKRKRKH